MAGKQVIFLCLASVSLVASFSVNCVVDETQSVYIESTCKLETQTVSKVRGRCPMAAALMPGDPVCHSVETENCIVLGDREHCHTGIPREICVQTWVETSPMVPVVRRSVRGTDTCETDVAVCGEKSTTETKKEKCTASF